MGVRACALHALCLLRCVANIKLVICRHFVTLQSIKVVEWEAVSRAIALAEIVDCPIQIFHVTAAEVAEEVARAQSRGLKVWGETCTCDIDDSSTSLLVNSRTLMGCTDPLRRGCRRTPSVSFQGR